VVLLPVQLVLLDNMPPLQPLVPTVKRAIMLLQSEVLLVRNAVPDLILVVKLVHV